MLVKTYAASINGIDAELITIEVNLSSGFRFSIVGLPDSAVKESQDRITTAIMNSDYPFPRKQIVINLAPAYMRKEGTGYDLTLAVGILAASDVIASEALEGYIVMGELSLDGSVRGITASLSIAIMARQLGFKGFILPKENAKEAAVVGGLDIIGVENLTEVVEFLNGNIHIEKTVVDTQECFFSKRDIFESDFKEVCGQETAKRAIEIAVAGGHNLIMIGTPGSGKSMLAKCVPSIMPSFTLDEALETTKIHSVAGQLPKDTSLMTTRPFRSPHNNVSGVALLGGGSYPKPGEISLAHNGVLFLDELPQYNRAALEELRQPLEDHKISISRAKFSAEFPSSFMLIAAMNPCPCGHYGDPNHECTCSQIEVQKYMSRISGPLMDRIDLQVKISPLSHKELLENKGGEKSADIRARVEKARKVQQERFKNEKTIHCNGQMEKRHCDMYCKISTEAEELLEKAMKKLNFSARGYFKVLKLARTIADLADSVEIDSTHVKEALSYRSLDRESW